MRTIYQPKDFSTIYRQLTIKGKLIHQDHRKEQYEFFDRIYTVEIRKYITKIYSDPKT